MPSRYLSQHLAKLLLKPVTENCFWLELGKMEAQDFRPEISVLQLHSKANVLSMDLCVCVYPRWGDSPVALQPRCVPDLGLDSGVVQLDGPGAELHADGGATIVVELIFSKAGQKVALPHAGLPDQNN